MIKIGTEMNKYQWLNRIKELQLVPKSNKMGKHRSKTEKILHITSTLESDTSVLYRVIKASSILFLLLCILLGYPNHFLEAVRQILIELQ